MSKILFKKNFNGMEKVTDTIIPIFIEHDYFGFNDNNYPSESFQFRDLIKNQRVSLIRVDKDSKFYGSLNHLIVPDKGHDEHQTIKVEAEKKHQEERKKADDKEKKAKDKAEAKRLEAIAKAEKKKADKQKVKIVTGEDISKSITDNI